MTTDHHHDTDEDSADRHETAASDAVADWEPEIEPSPPRPGGGGGGGGGGGYVYL